MRVFHCDSCEQLVFFESTQCVTCGSKLGFNCEARDVIAIEPVGGDEWRKVNVEEPESDTFRPCQNYAKENLCNWLVGGDDPNPFCRSCRLTHTIPDLALPGNREAWAKLETAKRRLIYSLLKLHLPLVGKIDTPEDGLAFDFLADSPTGVRALTGHSDGLITVNISEADDAEREKRRLAMHEPYRTLLGHFRHESGHYYWDRLLQGSDHLDEFRQLFGDERADYDASLKRHYETGAPPDWPQKYVSAYASAHPWEDWAESWAHYLHISDALETAADCGLTLRPKHRSEPSLKLPRSLVDDVAPSFDVMISGWFALTYVLNNLNRGLGLPDGYPFVLSPPAIEKLRFVHNVVRAVPAETKQAAAV